MTCAIAMLKVDKTQKMGREGDIQPSKRSFRVTCMS